MLERIALVLIAIFMSIAAVTQEQKAIAVSQWREVLNGV